ncbi:FHA domain-containing protein [Dictyobacter alpinus]|uniref:FHA domain-containing protein n=1 Tax=Dictyobacter alpinus TaxID=2014873 RepID=UPI000F845CA3|nr:FHA domain-containing protein [Dictyobacter alpinus]
MREPYLMTFAFAGLNGLISTPVIVVAILAIAILVILGAVFVLRSNKKKPAKSPGGVSGTSDWQRQSQPGAAGAWNPPSSAGNWNQQQQPGQAQNSWGAPGAPQQQPQQQQGANPWGAPNPSQPSWGNNPAQPAQPANPWGNNPAQPDQVANPWGNNPAPAEQTVNPWGNNPAQPAQPANQQPWGAPNPSQPSWGGQGNPASPWDPASAAAPAPQTQDNWNQPRSGSGQQWGAPAGSAQPQQPQAPAAWNQQQQPEAWGAAPKPPSAPFANPNATPSSPFANPSSAPSWQSNQGGFGQDPNAMYGGNADSDKTMLRSQGPQMGAAPQVGGAIGYVRVEEGKEPGRIYEIRKESLSMGRSRESDIFLEDLAVSRLHASLVNMGNGSYALKDEGSANGTKVNGQLVNKFQTYPLQEGDRIQLGQTVLVFAKK